MKILHFMVNLSLSPQYSQGFFFAVNQFVAVESMQSLIRNHYCLQTGDAAVQLGEKGAYQALDSKLQKLAATHINAGVTDDQFEVIRLQLSDLIIIPAVLGLNLLSLLLLYTSIYMEGLSTI